MIIAEGIVQGTPEWRTARAGIPTSSSFDMIITTAGKPSKQRQKYLYALAAERITGAKENHYQNGIMQRGIELESEARAMYELITGNEVKQVGVCFPEEIKCPLSYTHVGYLLDGALPVDYFAQTQGQLLVTSRKYVDFFSYYPGLKPLLIKVKPDKAFLKALAIELEIFVKELDEITEKLRGI